MNKAWALLHPTIMPLTTTSAFNKRSAPKRMTAFFCSWRRGWAVSSNHPNYFDPNVIIGGFMFHFFFTVPLALIVKKRLAAKAEG